MSYHIPFQIQEEIIKKLPIKSLLQFRSVSKPWKSFIDSSNFIASYHRTQQRHHLLVSYTCLEDISVHNHVSIVDDETFPKQKIPLTLPVSVKQLTRKTIVGSCQGLLCFYDDFDSGTETAVIWNPFVRKSVTISVPNVLGFPYRTVFAFGVTPDTCDPKLVKISFDRSLRKYGDTVVEVFSLSTMSWKRLTTNLPRNSTVFCVNHVVIDRFIYWHAYDLRYDDPRYHGLEQIFSFDMITEEFKEFDLPDSLARDHSLFLSKVREESLAVVQMKWCGGNQVVSVWMMEHGDPKSLTKHFTINNQNKYYNVSGFRKSGEPLINMRVDDPEPPHDEHFVYEPYSGHMNSIGITAYSGNFGNSGKVASCIETLLLLDH